VTQPAPGLQELQKIFAELGFITTSPEMGPLLQRAYKAARVSDAVVLLQGETGTGKQVLARAIHKLDCKRRNFPIIAVHCSTISESLAEGELFGHRKGSFSGTVTARKGLFQVANGGTVFLDDVNDLPLRLHSKLLDVLQRGVIRPLGADRELPVHVRVVAAANHPFEPLVEEGSFRADLFHGLNVICVCLPPLRERADDIEALILEFARRHVSLHQLIELPDLMEHLREHRFEGNVRELENAVPQLTRQVEAELLQRALRVQGKTRRELAKLLHTSERTLYHNLVRTGWMDLGA
jgi:transcriptional regulator with PAS, ATPase and Fis domain